MKGRSLLLLGLVALLVCVMFVWVMTNQNILGTHVAADAYVVDGEPMGKVLIAVSFNRAVIDDGDDEDDVRLQVAVDWNADGAVADDEWAVRNIMPLIRKDGVNRFAVPVPLSGMDGLLPVHVALSNGVIGSWGEKVRETVAADVEVTTHDVLSVWDFMTPGSSEDRKRGIFAETASAQNAEVDVQRTGDVSDLSGGPMDCFPISAANNLTSLAEEHGQRDQLPANPTDIVNELKQDMKFQDGVLTQDFVAGKQAFVERYGLPVTTEVIEKPTFQDIADALASGGAVEMSMSHVASSSGRPNAGHVVTAVGAAGAGGQMGVFAHDPATPVGADFLEVTTPPPPNTFWRVDYPFWDGVTVIDYIYVQRWNATAVQQSGLDVRSEESRVAADGISVEVLVIGGKKYPRMQFRVGVHEVCDSDHYHSDHSRVFATDLTTITDPLPGSCGFGKVSEVSVETVVLTPEEQTQLMGAILGN